MNAPELQFAVTYQNLSTFALEFERQIVSTGVYLKTNKSLQLGKLVGVHFRFKDTQEALFATGTVAWVDPAKDVETGRITFLVRDLHLNPESHALLKRASGHDGIDEVTPAYQPAQHPAPAYSPPPPPPQYAPPQAAHGHPQSHPHPVAHPQPSHPAQHAATPAAGKQTGKANRKKKIIIAAAIFLLLIGLVAGWFFGMGGMKFVMTRFIAPPARLPGPPALAVPAPAQPPLIIAEKPVEAPPPPPPKKVIPPAKLVDFEYYQGPNYNRFVLIFDRAGISATPSKSVEPMGYVLYIDRASIHLEKEQFFLPYTWIRTISFEDMGGAVRVTFLATGNYLPQADLDIEGRKITVQFIPTN